MKKISIFFILILQLVFADTVYAGQSAAFVRMQGSFVLPQGCGLKFTNNGCDATNGFQIISRAPSAGNCEAFAPTFEDDGDLTTLETEKSGGVTCSLDDNNNNPGTGYVAIQNNGSNIINGVPVNYQYRINFSEDETRPSSIYFKTLLPLEQVWEVKSIFIQAECLNFAGPGSTSVWAISGRLIAVDVEHSDYGFGLPFQGTMTSASCSTGLPVHDFSFDISGTPTRGPLAILIN